MCYVLRTRRCQRNKEMSRKICAGLVFYRKLNMIIWHNIVNVMSMNVFIQVVVGNGEENAKKRKHSDETIHSTRNDSSSMEHKRKRLSIMDEECLQCDSSEDIPFSKYTRMENNQDIHDNKISESFVRLERSATADDLSHHLHRTSGVRDCVAQMFQVNESISMILNNSNHCSYSSNHWELSGGHDDYIV